MGWLHRLYGSPLVVQEVRGSLLFLEGVQEGHNGWSHDRFEKIS
jgi:hypothetical protein